MSRYFNNKEVELLAPVGNFDIFKDVIRSKADAVYFGGKKLNMRMHRKDYNLSNDEIVEAISMAHKLNKKVYITVNNLFSHEDLEDAKEFLTFLDQVKPDALLVQDLSVLHLINELDLHFNIHSSVMMNVHNLETIHALRKMGVTRVVASRDIDLKTIHALHKQTDMEFEYFTHGDMCVAHGAQCLYSASLFGKSSNRGLCMKPCRWNFKLKKDGLVYPTEYPLAVKDLSMYEHLPEMIEAGIMSFKIEGRMRTSDYLVNLINAYGDALDRYIEDPLCYDRKKDAKAIFDSRKRDLSTGYAFGKPGLDNINRRYEGTGKFYSTGKVFSKPIEERDIQPERLQQIKTALHVDVPASSQPVLTVKVNSFEHANVALNEGADVIYLSGDTFEPDQPFSKQDILSLTSRKKDSKIYLGLPRMMHEEDFSKYAHLLRGNHLGLDGLLVTNLGAIHYFKDTQLELIGDYCLNIYNEKAIAFYKDQGLSALTLSVEAPLSDTKEAISTSALPIEVVAHGAPVVMYLEHDLYANTTSLSPVDEEDNLFVDNHVLVLVDEKGHEHPVYRDHMGRNHLIPYKDLCYLPILKELQDAGASRFRIEGSHYRTDALASLIKAYKKALDDVSKCASLYQQLTPTHAGFTLGSLQFD